MPVPQVDHQAERESLEHEEPAAQRAHERPPDQHAGQDRHRLREEVQHRRRAEPPDVVDDPVGDRRARQPGEVVAHQQLVAQVVRERPAQREVPVQDLVERRAGEHQRNRELDQADRPLIAARHVDRRQPAQPADHRVERERVAAARAEERELGEEHDIVLMRPRRAR